MKKLQRLSLRFIPFFLINLSKIRHFDENTGRRVCGVAVLACVCKVSRPLRACCKSRDQVDSHYFLLFFSFKNLALELGFGQQCQPDR